MRVKSHLKWIFSHAIRPKKYKTAPQGLVRVRSKYLCFFDMQIWNFLGFQQPPTGWPKEKPYFGREYMVNPFCTRNALDNKNPKIRKGNKKRRLSGRYKRKRPGRYKTRKSKLRRQNKQKRRINYRKSRPHRIKNRRRRKYF